MITPDVLTALRVLALGEANDKTYDSWYASICRWYSREFHTPLKNVEDFSEQYVLETYYKDLFWRLANGNKEQKAAFKEIMVAMLTEGNSQIKEAVEEIEEEDDEWYQQELADLDRKMSEKSSKTNDKKVSPKAAVEPNLMNEAVNIHVEADDEPVPDEGF